MSDRYAVLWEPTDEGSRPVGVAVEQPGFVAIEVRGNLGVPTRYDDPFDVRGPDMHIVRYAPGDEGYFDQVLLDLSRAFIIGEQSSVENATQGVVLRLLTTLVLQPLRLRHQDVYLSAAPTYPAVVNYRKQYYSYEPSTGVGSEQPMSVPVPAGHALVVA
jgi:hypothetical protein